MSRDQICIRSPKRDSHKGAFYWQYLLFTLIQQCWMIQYAVYKSTDIEKDVMFRDSILDFIKCTLYVAARYGIKYPFYGLSSLYLLVWTFVCFFECFPAKKNNLILLFKSSAICRIFHNPGSPRSPLFTCLQIH